MIRLSLSTAIAAVLLAQAPGVATSTDAEWAKVIVSGGFASMLGFVLYRLLVYIIPAKDAQTQVILDRKDAEHRADMERMMQANEKLAEANVNLADKLTGCPAKKE